MQFKTKIFIFTSVVVSLIYSGLVNGAQASSTFTQSDWSGGATANTATDSSNQTGWTQYNAKDSGVSAGSSLQLSAGSGNSDINFNSATESDFNQEDSVNGTSFESSSATLHSIPFNDDFSSSTINADRWAVSGSGGTASISSGQLYFNIPAANDNITADHQGTVGTGDFDVQVDFNNLSHSSTSWWATLQFSSDSGQNIIQNNLGQVGYFTRIYQNGTIYSHTTSRFDTSGKLRITRVGSTATVYAWYNSTWNVLYTHATTAEAGYFRIYSGTTNGSVSCYFDNFTASGDLTAPTAYPTSQAYYITTAAGSQLDVSAWSNIDSVTTTQTTPTNTDLKYLVSLDGRTTWKYWDGSAWQTSTLANIETNGMSQTTLEGISSANWSASGGFQAGTTSILDFAVSLSTTDASVTPTISQIQASTLQTQALTSSIYNTENPSPSLTELQWTATTPTNTSVKFQLRTSSDGSTWGPWCGPDDGVSGSCSTSTYFTDSSGAQTIDDTQRDGSGDQYFQYKAYLTSTDGVSTPTVSAVSVSYGQLPPTVSSVTPSSGSINGGDSVTITGTNFYGTPTVTFGGTASSSVTLVDSNTLSVTTPAGSAGAVDVVVTNPDSQSATLTGGFTYVNPAPTVSSVSPSSGLVVGGTDVTISGSNFYSDVDSDTKLLLHGDGSGTNIIDSSSYANTITNGGSVSQTTSVSEFGGSSMSFNGDSGSYLGLPTSSSFDFDSSDYTIDFWFNSKGGSNKVLLSKWTSAGGSRWAIFSPSDGILEFYSDDSGWHVIKTGITDNAWHHFAWVHIGTSTNNFYIDGALALNYSRTVSNNNNNLYIGSFPGGDFFNGYMDEIRFSKGIARWTSDFTPPTAPYEGPHITIGGASATNVSLVDSSTLTATTPAGTAGAQDVVVTNPDSQSATLTGGFTYVNPAPTVSSVSPSSGLVVGGTDVTISGSNFYSDVDSDTKLLLHGDGSGTNIIDSSSYANTITNGGSVSQTTSVSEFGGSSMSFNGDSGSYLGLPTSSSFDFDSSDYTIDFWFNSKGGSNKVLLSKWTSAGGSRWAIFSPSDGILEFYSDDSGWHVIKTGITDNAWHHFAWVHIGTSTNNFYIDGALALNYSRTVSNNNNNLYIGSFPGGDFFNGYMDEIRFSKGIARWTSDFTPPTAPYEGPHITIGGASATNVSLVDSSTLTATTPAGTAGAQDVVVTNPNSQAGTLTGGFTYIAPPTVLSVSPASVSNDQSSSALTISGQDFQSGATVKFSQSGQSDINCTNVSVTSPAGLTCDASFYGVSSGDWTVTVTNPDSQSNSHSNIFSVTGQVTQIAFASAAQTILPSIPSNALIVELRDVAGNPAPAPSSVTVDLATDSSTGDFSLSNTNWSSVSSVTFSAGNSSAVVYYKDSTAGTYTLTASENPDESWTDATQSITVDSSAPYSWPFDVSSNYQYDSSVMGVSSSYAQISDLSQAGSNPTIENVTGDSLEYSTLSSFAQTLGPDNAGSVKYQLSPDGGTTWFYWNGSSWASTTGGVSYANDASTINTNISSFAAADGVTGVGQLSFKAFLISDGTQKVQLDAVTVGYKLYPYKYVFTQVPSSLSETQNGTFTVQGQDQYGNVLPVRADTTLNLATSTPTTGQFAVDLNEDASTRWDHTSITLLDGEASGTFYYRDSQKGTKTITATSTDGNGSLAASTSLSVDSRYRFLVTGITNPVRAGVPSSVTVQAVDYDGTPDSGYTGTVHFSSDDSLAILPSDFTFTSDMLGEHTFINGVTMMTQGTFDVTATDNSDSVISGTQSSIVVDAPPAGTASQIKIITDPQYVPVSTSSSTVTFQLQDSTGAAVSRGVDTTIYINDSSATGKLSTNGNSWSGNSLTVTIPAGATSGNVYFKDATAGSYTLSVGDDATLGQDQGFTNDDQAIAIVAGPPTKFSFDSSFSNLSAGTVEGPYTVTLRDSSNDITSTFNNQAAYVTSANGAQFSLDGSTGWTNTLSTSIISGQSSFSFYYKNTNSGSDTVTISDANPANGNTGLIDTSVSASVAAGNFTTFAFVNAPSALTTGESSGQVRVESTDIYGNVVLMSSATTAYLYSDSSNTQFSTATNFSSLITQAVIPAGSYISGGFYLREPTGSGTINISASDNSSAADGDTGIADANQAVQVSAGNVSKFVFTNSSPLALGAGDVSGALTIKSENAYGVVTPVSSDTTVYLFSSDGAGEFSSSASSWSAITQTTLAAGEDSLTIYFKDTQSGGITLTAGDDSSAGTDSGITNASLAAQVSPGSLFRYSFLNAPSSLYTNQPATVNVGAYDQYGNLTPVTLNKTVYLYSDNAATQFSSTSDFYNPITQITIPAGSSASSDFYLREPSGSGTINISGSDNSSAADGDTGIADATAAISVSTGSVAKFTFTNPSPFPLVAGTQSAPITLETTNAYGYAIPVATDTTVYFFTDSSASTKEFSLAKSPNWSAVTSATLAAGQDSLTLYYKDTGSGTVTVTAGDDSVSSTDTNLTNASLAVQVASDAPAGVVITSAERSTEIGQKSGAITLRLQDAFGNEAAATADTDISLATSGTGGIFYDINGNSVLSVTVPSGSSSATIYYETNAPQTQTISVSSDNLTGDSQTLTTSWGAPASLVLTAAPTAETAGEVSGPFTAVFHNSSGSVVPPQSDTAISLGTASGQGAFDTSASGSFDGSVTSISFAASDMGESFYYRDTWAHDSTRLTFHSPLVSNTVYEYLNVSADAAAALSFSNATKTVTINTASSAYTVAAVDQYGNQVTFSTDQSIGLSTDSAGGEFSSQSSPWSSIFSTVLRAGQSTFTFYYKDSQLGKHTLDLSSDFGTGSQAVSIVSAPVQDTTPTQYVFQSSPQVMIINSPATFNIGLKDSSNAATKAGGDLTATLTSDSATGEFYDASTDTWNATGSLAFSAGDALASFQYRDSQPGTPTLTVSDGSLTDATQQETVQNGVISQIAMSAPDSLHTSDRTPITLDLETSGGLPVSTLSGVAISLASSDANGKFYNSSGTHITSVTIPAGSYETKIYFQKTTPGDVQIDAAETPSQGWTDPSKTISVTAVASQLKFTSAAQTIQAGTETNLMTVRLQDAYNNATPVTNDKTLYLSSSSSSGEFFDGNNNAISSGGEITLPQNESSVSFYYQDTASGSATITVSDVSSPAESPDTGLTNATQTETINSAAAENIVDISGDSQNLLAGQTSAAVTMQLRDQYGNAKTVSSATYLYISSTSSNVVFSSNLVFSPAHIITGLTVQPGSSTVSFYFKDTVPEDFTITVSSVNSVAYNSNVKSGVWGVSSAYADTLDPISATINVSVSAGDPTKILWKSLPTQQPIGDSNEPIAIELVNDYNVEVPATSDVPVYFSSSSANGTFSLTAGDAGSANLSATISSGESELTLYYTDTVTGSPLLTASDVSSPAESPDTGLANATGYATMVYGSVSKLVITTAAQSIVANHPSAVMTVEALNSYDKPMPVPGDYLVYLRSTSVGGSFSSDGSTWGINGVTIPSGAEQVNFYYHDSTVGTPTITAADSLPISTDTGATNATQKETITAQTADHLRVTNISTPQVQGSPSSMVVMALDSDDYVVTGYAGTLSDITAYDSGNNPESDMLPSTPYTFDPAVDKGIKTFTNAVAFYSSGTKSVKVTDSNGLTGEQDNIIVSAASTGSLAQVEFISPSSGFSTASDESSTAITVQLQDSSGNPWNVTDASGYPVRITSSASDAKFSTDGSSWQDDNITLTVPQNLNFATFYYKAKKAQDYTLTVTDWQNGTDDSGIDNGTLDGTISSGAATYLKLTGNSSQTAGDTQTLTLTAYDSNDNVATGYTGTKSLTLSGASDALTGDHPACGSASFGSSDSLDFSSGVATCTLHLYRAEEAQIGATDGSISSSGDSSYALDVVVSPGSADRHRSVLTATPNPQLAEAPVEISLTPKDAYANTTTDSSATVVASVSGANAASVPLAYSAADGAYIGTYTPTASGTDLVTATVGGADVTHDSDGTSDGTYHETIGEAASSDSCDYINYSSHDSSSGEAVFNVCLENGNDKRSSNLSSGDSGDTNFSSLYIETKDSSKVDGQATIKSYDSAPSSENLPEKYADQSTYAVYEYFKVSSEFDFGDTRTNTLAFYVDKGWLSDNNVTDVLAVKLSSGKALTTDKKTISGDTVYAFDSSDPSGYWAIIGKVSASTSSIPTTAPTSSPTTAPTTPPATVSPNPTTNNTSGDKNSSSDKSSSGEKSTKESSATSSPINSVISKLLGTTDPQKIQVARQTAANVSTAAAAGATLPMLPYFLGFMRVVSSVPLRRKKRWGIVYNTDNGHPIPYAMVSIIDENERVKEVKTADRNGVYFFLAKPGTYTFKAQKEGFSHVDKAATESFHTFYDHSYDRNDRLTVENEEVVSVNIPMEKVNKALPDALSWSFATHAIFWGGFAFSGGAVILDVSLFNILVLLVFIGNFLYNTFVYPSLKGGWVKTPQGAPVPFASIKFFDTKDDSLSVRTTANEKGMFVALLNPGTYRMEVQFGGERATLPVEMHRHSEYKKTVIFKNKNGTEQVPKQEAGENMGEGGTTQESEKEKENENE